MRRTGFTELLVHQLGGSTLMISGVWAETSHGFTQKTLIRSIIRFICVYARPYNSVRCLSREPMSSVNAFDSYLQAQFPSVLFGRFMRASVPRPSRSCNGMIAVFGTEASTPRIKSQ